MYAIKAEVSNPQAKAFVFDLSELSALMWKLVLDDVDHHNLNTDVDWLRGVIPTTENLANAIWERLDPNLPHSHDALPSPAAHPRPGTATMPCRPRPSADPLSR